MVKEFGLGKTNRKFIELVVLFPIFSVAESLNNELSICDFASFCANGGTCQPIGTYGFSCQCTPNYTGTFCQSPVVPNICDYDTLCANGGTCQPIGIYGFTCKCPPNYIGALCAYIVTTTVDNTSPCDTDPCGCGSCSFTEGDTIFYCTCSSNCNSGGGYGTPCRMETICDFGILCANGGTCIPSDDGSNFSCNCAGTGFTGTYCQNII